MNATETLKLEDAGKCWHNGFSKAFITQVSEGEPRQYYIKVQFRTLDEMHEAYRAMAALADLTRTPLD